MTKSAPPKSYDRDAEWFAENGGPLPDEERFRAITRERENAAWEESWDTDDELVAYGSPFGDVHPFDYRPDLECCTPEERERWLAACRAAEAGEEFERGYHTHDFKPDGQIIFGSTHSPWGIGVFVMAREGEATMGRTA